MKSIGRAVRVAGAVVGCIVVLFLLLASLLYVPAVQRWATNKACSYAETELGIRLSIERVKLAFPIDFSLEGTRATQGSDTLVCAKQLKFHARLLPLLKGEVQVGILSLTDARLNTLGWISNTQISGEIGEFVIHKPTAVNLLKHAIDCDAIELNDTRLRVELCDTAAQDTSESEPSNWKVAVNRIDVSRTSLYLQMPGDSMRVALSVGALRVEDARIDLAQSQYVVGRLSVSESGVSYDIPQVQRMEGFDANHLFVDSLSIAASDIDYTLGDLAAQIDRIGLHEAGSGIVVDSLSFCLRMTSDQLSVTDLLLLTRGDTRLTAGVELPWSSLKEGGNGTLKAQLSGQVDLDDAFAVTGSSSVLAPHSLLLINIGASGSVDALSIDTLGASIDGLLALTAAGGAQNLLSEQERIVDVRYDLSVQNSKQLSTLLPSTVAVPSLKAGGSLKMHGNLLSTDSQVSAGSGRMTLTGQYDIASSAYSARLNAQALPLDRILPEMGLGPFTARAEAQGQGFDFAARSTMLTARVDIEKFSYSTYLLDNTSLGLCLRAGILEADLESSNAMLQADLRAEADFGDSDAHCSLSGSIGDLALGYISSSLDSMHIGGTIDAQVSLPEQGGIGAALELTDLFVVGQEQGFMGCDLSLSFLASNDSTTAWARSGDMELNFSSPNTLQEIGEGFSLLVEGMMAQVERAQFESDSLIAMVPCLDLSLEAGQDNLLRQVLEAREYDFDSINIVFHSDKDLFCSADLRGLRTESFLMDDARLLLKGDSTGLSLEAGIENSSPTNPNIFTARLRAELLEHGAELSASFIDSEGRKGVDMGLRAERPDSNWTISLFPDTMTLAYRLFAVNSDNFLTLSPDLRVAANIDLLADDQTACRLVTQDDQPARDITLSLNNLNLRELTSTLPFLPSLGGFLGGDVHAEWTDSLEFSAAGNLSVRDLEYEQSPVGSFTADFVYLPDGDNHCISATLNTKDHDVLSFDGIYYTAQGVLDATASLDSLPADLLNGFMPSDGSAALAGRLNGDLTIYYGVPEATDSAVTTSGTSLLINGTLTPDSLQILSPLYNVCLLVENRPIEFCDSRLVFDDIRVTTSDDNNPLLINGDVDLSDLEQIQMNIDFTASDFKLIDARQNRTSLVYGDVYADIDASLRGTTEFMRITGSLNILGRTDVTYIMKDTPLTVEDQLSGLVEFVNFNDTTVVAEDTVSLRPSGMFMNLAINVADGAQLHALLSADGSSYVDALGGGSLNMQYLPSGEMKLTGTYTLTSGEMKYELPIIPLKTFTISNGSSIRFTGEMMDPALNITALEETRAAVSEDGTTTRMVDFNVGVSVGGKLSDMELTFIIEAPSDLNVQNDLNSVSTDERSKIALTLLATGIYMSDNNQSTFKANNALNAFLQSEIQSIAGNALRSVDLTVGVEGTTSASGESQTDYSFQFSKRFFNDRVTFKIGGKVSTGSTDESENQTFIDNVSLEYRLDNAGTRNIQAFYDHSSSDPFEGTYSSAGVGLVWRKKMDRLSELLIFK